jgi:hypothetical protein
VRNPSIISCSAMNCGPLMFQCACLVSKARSVGETPVQDIDRDLLGVEFQIVSGFHGCVPFVEIAARRLPPRQGWDGPAASNNTVGANGSGEQTPRAPPSRNISPIIRVKSPRPSSPKKSLRQRFVQAPSSRWRGRIRLARPLHRGHCLSWSAIMLTPGNAMTTSAAAAITIQSIRRIPRRVSSSIMAAPRTSARRRGEYWRMR